MRVSAMRVSAHVLGLLLALPACGGTSEPTATERTEPTQPTRPAESAPQAAAVALPEIPLGGEPIEGLEVEARREATAVAFDGPTVRIAGRALSFSFTDGTEDPDCGGRVVPLRHHYVRESPDTARMVLAVENRRGGDDCTEGTATPRLLVQAPIPAEVARIHLIFDLVDVGKQGAAPALRYEQTIPVEDGTRTLSPG